MDSNQSATSWGAIIAGAVAAAALTLVLVSLGSAVGFSSVSPWPSAGVSAKTFQISTGLYFVFTALVASTVGGYMAGRLRTKWTGLHGYEVQFRDTAHGFLAWGLATLAGTAFLDSAGALLAGGTAAGMSAGSSQAGNSNADYYTAMLLAPSQGAAAAQPGATPAPTDASATPRQQCALPRQRKRARSSPIAFCREAICRHRTRRCWRRSSRRKPARAKPMPKSGLTTLPPKQRRTPMRRAKSRPRSRFG
jgi:hypothetical protein